MKSRKQNVGVLRATNSFLGMVAIAASIGTADATCWRDANVTELAQSVAQSGFPNAASRMPAVLICEGSDFGPNIGGDYTGGIHRIRIPQWQLNSAGLRSVLAHELAHAETWLTGGSDANHGHSADFMRALLRAGWGGEAQRVGQHVVGAQYALDEARASLYPRGASPPLQGNYRPPVYTPPYVYTPPSVMVEVCHDEQMTVVNQVRPGRYQYCVVTRRICQWVPVQ